MCNDLHAMKNIAYCILSAITVAALEFDRHVLKRHLNIETPLYRLWWKYHSESMQRKLDSIHSPYPDF